MSNFSLSLVSENGNRLVDFSNNTNNFVEVVLDIDGSVIKGYCYPPFHHKPIRKLRDGRALPFSNSGRVRAYIFSGIGQLKNDVDLDVPPWIRRKLYEKGHISTDQIIQQPHIQKVIFRRTSLNPIEMLEIPY